MVCAMSESAKRKKDPAAVRLGRRGGKARAAKLSPQERSRIARHAANVRHARGKEKQHDP